MKIKNLHLYGFYYLFIIESNTQYDSMGFSDITIEVCKKMMSDIVVDFIYESEKIIIKTK